MRRSWELAALLAALLAAAVVGSAGWCDETPPPAKTSADGLGQAVRDDAPLFHWTFDDDPAALCRDSGRGGWHAEYRSDGRAGVRLGDGLFATALQLEGDHRIGTVGPMPHRPAAEIAFSAWVTPADLR
ncbi:MAG: hypothetical protein GYA33_12430, partial [Thermogutta sp.]|nr:hypothetical protein [Thermogutta sp.]